ncbi:MAG: T9SS type A sorting domain-containing protein [Bacteroidetes bacterium]|nr:T9SS type A sorting domain-containing protein [Bacteroidota bacterium]
MLGRFSSYDGIPNKHICRVDTLGNLDTSFQHNVVGGFIINEAFVQNDGKIILAGNMILNNSLDTFQLIRIFPDGSLDSTFNNEIEIWSDDLGMAIGCNTISQTRDSGFIIGGSFTQIDGHPRGRIAKIDMNGNLNLNEFNGTWVDSVVGVNIGLTPWVRQVIADPYSAQERYYVGGDYNRVNGIYYNGLFRLIVDSTQIGIHENGLSKLNVRVYPNPFNENITITIPAFESNYSYSVVDISGKMIESGLLKSSVSTIDLGNLVKGFYLLNIENLNGHEKASIKIIK